MSTTQTALDSFTRAYIECALWSSIDDSDTPMDQNYSIDDLAPETLAEMASNCEDFQTANADLLATWYGECGESTERAGHDFWLTRNGHGAGFWDRWSSSTPQGKIGNTLADAARVYGSVDLYVGDDGKVYAQ